MKVIDNILSRNSISKLGKPHPTSEEMELVYKSALRAPDHAWLRPSQFIEISGKGLDKLSEIFEKYAKENIENVNPEKMEKYKNAPYREIGRAHVWAAAQNILLSLHALNYGAIWRTGIFALNDKIHEYFNLNKNQQILGYLYVGKPTMEPKRIPEIDIDEFVTRWH